ncbi:hypothetical protein SAY86_009639 [Trapa natans]|uniref:Uncharacterized protein n=1 Tax=Trapa natans TaxID=22666 RepID=A0AAN7L025_TRANT|nr:hypothetical protein SAY86_009639 [Trapa natans]
MASHQYRPTIPPIQENEQEGEAVNHRYLDSEEAAADPSYSCFCFQWWSRGDYRNTHKPLLDGDGDGDAGHHQQQWKMSIKEKLMKVREVTEMVAGPKWKTFIRKIGGLFGKTKNRAQRGKFGYDADSYALNFDGGLEWEDEDDDVQMMMMYNARSSRFTGPSFVGGRE